ncbi:hypothetical protein BWQ96_03372 [Gracilariopsis chorda]|uniref:Uncharacterized protein n=1 Tax=Gracilariopsis chorda TaxID=448386 RepID=A0A2V3IXQ5_9FLOR|nr:hypothetical protein BWQ96_03372 [Gracilariopsis chorda]|eukprot:PXF46843.1 hypothetical protein BWQ96_03372 [Gracilariopsis chorda]
MTLRTVLKVNGMIIRGIIPRAIMPLAHWDGDHAEIGDGVPVLVKHARKKNKDTRTPSWG